MLPIHTAKISVFNYDDIPPGYYYQAMLQGHSIQKFWHFKKFLEVASRIPEDAKVLDIGCGPGSFLSVLGKQKQSVRAVGADIASQQIAFAQKHIATQFSEDRIRFVTLDEKIYRLPFEDHQFDVVTSIEVVEHIHPYIAFRILEDVKRVLKPEGKIIVTTPNYRSLWPIIEWGLEKRSPVKYHEQHISKFTPNAFVKFLEAIGFQIMTLDSIFIASPFLTPLSESLAQWVYRREKKIGARLGSLLIAEAQPLSF